MSKKGIFRTEAINQQRAGWKGKALLLSGFPAAWVMALCSLFIALFMMFIFFSNYTRRIEVTGEVITFPHAINIYAPQQGYIVESFKKVGDVVNKGDSLYSINVSRQTSTGNVSAETRATIKKQLENINQIIVKLENNKKETIDNLQEQLDKYEGNNKETKALVNNAREGVREMRRGLSNYEKYLKSGLINTDQLNNQRYMFYQQQTSYQSLNSQAIQETLQISQLRSQILTRAGEFDNNITQNEYQRNELERSLIESDAGGNIIIPAQSSGRLESLSVTPGQMVNVGSSLAQIQPLSNSKYYLVLWLPNNSLPYVKVNDGVNIRYDAFPSEKFGQFPGRIKSISYIPASKEEMSGYSSAPQNGNGVVENYYKVLVELKSAEVSDKGKEMHLSGGLKARTIVFLDTRKLYQWMFMPFYDIKNSVAGPVNE